MTTPMADAPPLVGLPEIEAAAERLRGVTAVTPLLAFGTPEPDGSSPAYLKPESLQPIGAFKLRGAYNAIAQLGPAERAAGVVAHSSGNHAQGVARAARLLDVRALIVMPSNASATKVERTRADGAQVILVGPSSDERAARAAELAVERGLTLIPPYDDPRIIAGQGTIGLEIVRQLAEQGVHGPFTVLVPVGGGGLAGGVVTAIRALRPDARVYGVEPALAADGRDSLAAGHIVRWASEATDRTIADGQRTTALGALPFLHLVNALEGMLTVEEDEICRAMVRAQRAAGLVLEPSGATALAALLFALPPDTPRPIVAVLSGGNVDPERYAALLARGEAAGG
ncbi:MAG TPA: threonine/serine dehydratase [Candidatus Limnocylindrales bacterium]